MRLPGFFYAEKSCLYPCIIKTRRNRIYFGFFTPSVSLVAWPKRSCPYLLLPAPFAAKLLPSREPARLRKGASAPVCLLARPTTSTRAGEGEAERETNSHPRPTAGPRTGAAGVTGPHPYPSPSGLAGGFVARRQPTLTIGSRGAGCGGQHPPGRGDGGGVLLSAHDPTGWEGARRKIRRGSPLPPTENQNPLERGSWFSRKF